MRYSSFGPLRNIFCLSSSVSRRFLCSAKVPRVAVVGSGPAGLFTCGSLLRRSSVNIDVFDAAPVPFGLVRYGVAPDHQEVKNCINGFDKTFEANRDRMSLFCNVRIGTDVTFEELTQSYDGVLLAYGAHRPRRMNIPGEWSKNVFSGSDFVSWYNGVPNAKMPLLDSPNVVIIGNGNVALDCARIISEGSHGESVLSSSDVPSEYLNLLRNSAVKNIKVLGRRGPTNISFTVKELREQFKLKEWNTTVEMDEGELESVRKEVEHMDRRKKRLMQVLLNGVKPSSGEFECRFLFRRTPQEVVADKDGRVEALRVVNGKTGVVEDLPCGLLIYSIGYEVIVLDGVPKNEKGSISMLDDCRVNMPSGCNSSVFAAGWCAHGPKGVIVDTQQQAAYVAEQMAKELNAKKEMFGCGVKSLLDGRGVDYVSWEEWKRIDNEEQSRGHERGKCREKIIQFDEYRQKKRGV